MTVDVRVIALAVAFISIAIAAPIDTSCEFKCKDDGKCISSLWKCDNVKDCADGSDEENCSYLHRCNKGEFMCLGNSNECIPASQKCNGVKECSDGSDERACVSNEAMNLPSADDFEHDMGHFEVKTTVAPSTTVKPFVRDGQCLQRNSTLFFSNNGVSVYQLRLDNDSSTPTVLAGDIGLEKDTITSLTHTRDSNELLFTTKRSDARIQAIKSDGKVRVFANHESQHFGRVVVDPLTQNVYFTEDGFGIGVCDKNGRNCLTLVAADSHDQRFRDLILHTTRGTMLWIQDDPTPVIKIAGMDGKDPRHLGFFGDVYAIAMDTGNEHLYVAEENAIVRVSMRTLFQTEFAAVRASALLFHNCDLFYVQRDVPSLHSINSRAEDKLISSLGGSIFALTAVTENERVAYNPCSVMGCPELCVLTESSISPEARCVCSICGESAVVKAEGSTLGWVITIFMVVLLVTLLVMFLVVYFRLWPALCDRLDELLGFNAHNTSNISVGFNNTDLH